LWTAPETIFSVVFEGPNLSNRRDDTGSDLFHRYWKVRAAANEGGIQSYFDYEGGWALSMLGVEPRAYPRGFRTIPWASEEIGKSSALLDTVSVRSLLNRQWDPSIAARASGIFSRSRLPRRERRLINSGRFVHRILPDFRKIPPVRGTGVLEVVFVTGVLRAGAAPGRILPDLVRVSKVAPFLLIYDHDRLLLAVLAPLPPTLAPRRTRVLEVLRESLSNIETVRIRLDALSEPVDHRYDRLLP
jgi:hypothetical protein